MPKDRDASIDEQKTLDGIAKDTAARSLGDEPTRGGAVDDNEPAFDSEMEIVDLSARHTIDKVLGKGGMGQVLLATDTRLNRKVAINTALLALANPSDPKQSWSHFNVYDREDQSQAFRFQKIQVTRFPTILVQPPRTGKYGEPETLVFQKVYGGEPSVLAKEIVEAIRNYVAKVAPAPVAPNRDFTGSRFCPLGNPHRSTIAY